MADSRLSTRRLPDGVTATPVWGDVQRADGKPRDRFVLTWRNYFRNFQPPALIIGMNPSGGGDEADATLVKNWEFSRRWTNGPMIMMNVIPTRATSPKEMRFDAEAMAVNRQKLKEQLDRVYMSSGKVIVMWGNPSLSKDKLPLFLNEAKAVCQLVRDTGLEPLCLGVNENGSPKHSLMLAYETPLVPYAP